MLIMVALAVFYGCQNRGRPIHTQSRVLIVAALLIDGLELFKIVLFCFRSGDPLSWLYDLPLFLMYIAGSYQAFYLIGKKRAKTTA